MSDKDLEVEIGQTVRENHDDCQAGVDTRRRLYITRTMSDPTRLLYYCHNCQRGWMRDDNGYQKYRNDRHQIPPTSRLSIQVDTVEEPPNLIRDLALWPNDAQAWAIKNGLTYSDCHQYGIQHDPSTNRVYLPRYAYVMGHGRNPDLMGYQLRNVSEAKGPKYLTVLKANAKPYSKIGSVTTSFLPASHRRGVIVEDYISGIHIVKAAKAINLGVTAIVNYGVRLDLETLASAAGYKKVLVWLDNDSEHVRQQARAMEATLKLLGCKDVQVITALTDPKYCAQSTIQGILNG